MSESAGNVPYARAVELYNAGQVEDSIARFEEAIALQPQRGRIHTNLARALHDSGRRSEALNAARKGAALASPGDLYVYENLVWLLDENGEQEEIVATAERELGRDGWSDEERNELLASLCVALVDLGDAHQATCKALRRVESSQSARLWEIFASALAHLDRWGEALRAIRRTATLDADNRKTYQGRRAILERSLERLNPELEGARVAAQERANDWEAHHELAVLLMMSGDLEAAARAFDAARKCHPAASEFDDGAVLSKWEFDCDLALLARGLGRATHEAKEVEPVAAERFDDDDDIPF